MGNRLTESVTTSVSRNLPSPADSFRVEPVDAALLIPKSQSTFSIDYPHHVFKHSKLLITHFTNKSSSILKSNDKPNFVCSKGVGLSSWNYLI